MSKLVLVTGASGYIGGQTMLQLKDAGHTVVGVDTVALPMHLRCVADRFYQEDFSKPRGLQLLDEFAPTAVVHCAGSSLVGPSLDRPADYYNNNFVKTKILLDRIRDHKLDTRVIFSSSAACYGEPVMTPCSEVDPCEPISPYGESKLMIEWMLKSYRRAYGLDFVAFRYFNACGADSQGRHGQQSGATHIIARVLESLRDDREFTLYGENYDTSDGTCIRDYVHVEDISKAHIMAIDRSLPSGVFNLGTKSGASNKEIISTAEEITGRKLKSISGPRREGDPAILTASAEKWSQASGWSPEFDLRDMISHAWHWYTR
jgi:UDP-glucose-4-epimerase GalE